MPDRTSSRDTHAPLILGDFELIEPIASGGMARVWRGRHPGTGAAVAVKMMAGAITHTPLFRAAFRNEARAVASLDHPHLVQLYDYGEVDEPSSAASGGQLVAGTPFLVMALAHGGTLLQYRHPLPWHQLRSLLLQLLEALSHAHARQVIHLDIKPGNVLLVTPDLDKPWVRLSDFGISYIYGESRRDAAEGPPDVAPWYGVGTPTYMAPEQFSGAWRDYGPWTDLYSLGCLAWRLATGHPPFTSEAHRKLMWAHFTQKPGAFASPHPQPSGLESWLRRLLEKNIERRFGSAADAAWTLLSLDPPPSAPPALNGPVDWSDQTPVVHPGTDSVQALDETLAPQDNGDASSEITEFSRWSDPANDQTRTQPPGGQNPPFSALEPARTQAPAQTLKVEDAQEPTQRKSPARGPDLPPFPLDWRSPAPPSASLFSEPSPRLFGLRITPLVGRELARDVLWQTLAEVHRSRKARMVLVQGPAGIGKSHLSRWFVERAIETGAAEMLRVQFSREHSASTALTRMMMQRLRLAGMNRVAARHRLGLELKRLSIPGDAMADALLELLLPVEERTGEPTTTGRRTTPASLSRHQEHHALIRRWLEALAAVRPVILWLDDVQWGDEALQLVERLLETPTPIMIVLTLQDEAVRDRPFVMQRIALLTERGDCQRLRLEPLSESEQLEVVLKVAFLEQELALQVVRRSGGYPLFAIQLVGDWLQRGLLAPGPHGYRLQEALAPSLPDDIHQLWLKRLARATQDLPGSPWLALEAAAALGEEVVLSEWEQLCRHRGHAVPDGLLDAMLHQQLVQVARPREDSLIGMSAWSFVHGLLRESLERHAREHGRWESLNLACAQLLDNPELAEKRGIAERRALHLLAARADRAALEPLLLAARARAVDQEWHEASRLLDLRDATLDRLNVPEQDLRRLEGAVERVTSCWRLLPMTTLTDLIRMARDGLAALPESPLYLLALLLDANLTYMNRQFSAAIPLYQEVMARHLAREEPEALAFCQFNFGRCLFSAGRLPECIEVLKASLAYYAEAGQPLPKARCLVLLGDALRAEHRFDEALPLLMAGLELFEQQNMLEDYANCLRSIGSLKLDQQDPQGAIPFFEQALLLVERLHHTSGIAHQHLFLGEAMRASGNYDAAEVHYLQSAERYDAKGVALADVARVNLAIVYLAQGHIDKSLLTLETVRPRLEARGEHRVLEVVYFTYLGCAATIRDWECWDRHWRQLESPPRSEHRLAVLDLMPLRQAAECAARAGERARAEQAITHLTRRWPLDLAQDQLALLQQTLLQPAPA